MVKNFVLRLLVTALVAYLLSFVLEPHIRIQNYVTALIFAMALALLNAVVRPLLVLFTLPITVVTLGIFLIVINVLMIMLAGAWVNGIYIENFWWALIFGFLLSFFSGLFAGKRR